MSHQMTDTLDGHVAQQRSERVMTPSATDCQVSITRDMTTVAMAWTDLERQPEATAFQSYAWCSAWADATTKTKRADKPYIVTIRKHGRIVLLWPLAVRRLGPFRILVAFGDPAVQYCDALVEPGSDRLRLLDLAFAEIQARADADALFIKGVRSDAVIAGHATLKAGTWSTRVAAAPFVDFHTDPAARRRSGRTLNALRRHLRNLAEHGAVAFTMVEDAQDRVAAVREALILKHDWLSRRGQLSAGYRHPANATFLSMLAADRHFMVAKLDVGGQTAAIEAGILKDGRYWSLVQSYDPRYATYGPGRLLFWHVLDRAKDLGIETFDFLAPAHAHKTEWATGQTEVQDHLIPLRLGGRAVLGYFRHVRPWAYRLINARRKA